MSTPGKGKGGGGVLPINAAATKRHHATQGSLKPVQKGPSPRLRLIIRRLPPGLTESEFWSALGDDWNLGKGRIDWSAYKDGKVSKEYAVSSSSESFRLTFSSPSKPSRPARVYLKVKDQSMLDNLSAHIKQTHFQDAKNTTKDSCLLGPPSLEFAPYSKMQTGRVRHDGRQGTIDQDQEFIDFLQSLTDPITKAGTNGVDPAEGATEKVTTTPLVQYLKEKKANKAKEAAEKKSKAKQENKEAKPAKGEAKSTVVVKGSTPAAEKDRVAKATQDAVKAINKSVASMQSKSTPVKTDAKPPAKEAPAPVSPAKRERERGNASAAARMLQRDLGLAPKSPRAARTTPASPATTKSDTTSTDKSSTTQSEPKAAASATTSAPPTGPRASRPPTTTPTSTTSAPTTPAAPKSLQPTPSQRPSKPLPNPSANAKSAFLKHANPSQGVTEDLLRTAFTAFGTVTRCEIDKKKGLGYIDFEDTETLRKAMQASPVKVGNGQVVVLENRNPGRAKIHTPAPAKTTTTQKPDDASTTAPKPIVKMPETSSPAASTATPVVKLPSAPSSPVATTAIPASATAPTTGATPTAPRASSRGGPRGGRGTPAAPRGSAVPARGGSRGGFRGPRGGSFGPRGGRGANANVPTVGKSAAPATAGSNTGGETGATGAGGNTGAEGGDGK